MKTSQAFRTLTASFLFPRLLDSRSRASLAAWRWKAVVKKMGQEGALERIRREMMEKRAGAKPVDD